MVRTAIAVFLALHGIIHLLGFAVPWRLATSDSFAYTTTAVWGRIELGDLGARVVALLWLPVMVAFLVAAYAIWQQASWELPFTAATAAASLILCVLASPAAIAGMVIDIGILAAIFAIRIMPHHRRAWWRS